MRLDQRDQSNSVMVVDAVAARGRGSCAVHKLQCGTADMIHPADWQRIRSS